MSSSTEDRDPTVLIIDSGEPWRIAIAATLAREGYQILTAATARDALAISERPLSAIDVVILDPRLPSAAATELCARLQRRSPRLPVIVCTAEANPAEVGRLFELGVRRYLLKPVTPDELLASVEAVLPR